MGYDGAAKGDWYGAGEVGFGDRRGRFAGGIPLPMVGDMALGDWLYEGGEKGRGGC
jgi:hypothetical protein